MGHIRVELVYIELILAFSFQQQLSRIYVILMRERRV